jgi:GxxExxY protein
MDMINADNYRHSDITEAIIKAYYNVYNTLGYGFLEKVYENAMFIELKEMGLYVEKQKGITVNYLDNKVGEYFADLIVNELVIIELKAAEALCEEHEFQLINYLKATDIEVGLLLNFGKKPEFRRRVFSNKRSEEIINDQRHQRSINKVIKD